MPPKLGAIQGKLAGAQPSPIDRHVGTRLRLRREALGISAGGLAEAAGLSLVYLRRFERGTARITARRLYEFGRLLDVPTAFFFDEGDRRPLGEGPKIAMDGIRLHSREAEGLLAAFAGISDRATRRKLIELAVALASGAAWPAVFDTASPCSG